VKLLTVGNTKTVKGEALGYMTFIMHLAPSTLSGYNTCPMASKGCALACLNTAGRGRFTATQEARIRKTRWFFENRETFMAQLVKDILAATRKAQREGMVAVFRLNGTSDIRWETVPVEHDGVIYDNIMKLFPSQQFYDYTKLQNRRNIPSNYHLTFSRSEENYGQVDHMMKQGYNVAIVFDNLPAIYNGYKVIDGTETDLRFIDPKGVIVGLLAKGKAKKDLSGFTVQIARAA
jgi:hypothetical protein